MFRQVETNITLYSFPTEGKWEIKILIRILPVGFKRDLKALLMGNSLGIVSLIVYHYNFAVISQIIINKTPTRVGRETLRN